MRLGEILRLAARRAPNKIAIIAGERRLTFSQYDRLSSQFSHFLRSSCAVQAGDRIACLLFNSPEYGLVHFGNARTGSILVHISPMYAIPEVARIIERTQPRVLIVDEAAQDTIAAIRDSLSSVERTVVVGTPVLDGACSLEEALDSQPEQAPDADVDPAEAVAMTFTGGTTGQPKGAVVSHNARYVSAVTTALEHRVAESDVTGVVTPMFHAVGLMIWYQATILSGCTSVMFRKWDPAEFVEQTERYGISSVFLVPVQVRDLLRSSAFDRERLTSLKNIGVGGALTPPRLIAECRAALPYCDYTDHYGQSETGPLTILKPWDTVEHAGTIGRAATGVDLAIVDEKGNEVPAGTTGELISRGPFLMDGYFEDEEETGRYFRGGDNWGWSGDLAVADENGFIRLVGRSKDMIVSGGINIYPREIETIMEAHPDVEECVAFGVPDERWGEALIAYVVSREGCNPTEDYLIEHCSGELARYKRPREIVFVSEIPKTASGKVQKPLLRSSFLKERGLH